MANTFYVDNFFAEPFISQTPTPSTQTLALTLHAPIVALINNPSPAPGNLALAIVVEVPFVAVDVAPTISTVLMSVAQSRPVVLGVEIDYMEYATTEEAREQYVTSGGTL